MGIHHERPPSTNDANVKPAVTHINVLLLDTYFKIELISQ